MDPPEGGGNSTYGRSNNMGFFEAVFGFPEQTTYLESQSKLLQLAQFEAVELPSALYPAERCVFHPHHDDDDSIRSIDAGIFSAPSLAELRDRAHKQHAKFMEESSSSCPSNLISVQNIVGEARDLHSTFDESSDTAIFQAASQFNLLEFAAPTVIPETGISIYVHDRTQGPACAVACAAGTAYRNYLLPFPADDNKNKDDSSESKRQQDDVGIVPRGQTASRQFNGMAGLEQDVVETLELTIPPWEVKNGYIESSPERLQPVNDALSSSSKKDDTKLLEDRWMSRIRIGVQEDTQVTDTQSHRRVVTQTYNSAISVGYSRLPEQLWAPVARLVLNATYEATLLVGLIKTMEQQQQLQAKTNKDTDTPLSPPIIFLTKVGGGVFQNHNAWIIEAIQRAVRSVESFGVPLDIRIVHFGKVEPMYERLSTAEAASTSTTEHTTIGKPSRKRDP